MSHVQMLAQLSGIPPKTVKPEQKTIFSSALNFGEIEVEKELSKGDRVELYLALVIDSEGRGEISGICQLLLASLHAAVTGNQCHTNHKLLLS
ncbi:hypothetical protein [Microbulbifer variabilis]|uniref:hypothetical protein n=1 Tax=Microbulbifer variabilis TaxID=266805 RepID=UPI001CFC8F5B|nr:hypothetical protein [Microbulbifer variabilis]